MSKPIKLGELKEQVEAGLGADFIGHLTQLSIAAFTQLLESEQKTCSLRVTKGDRTGDLHFINGRLTDARLDDLHGQDAALELLAWDKADVEIRDAKPLGRQRISESLKYLLLQAHWLRDERSRDEGDAADSHAEVEARRSKPISESARPSAETGSPDLSTSIPSKGTLQMGLPESVSRVLAAAPGVQGWLLISQDGRQVESQPKELEGQGMALAFILARAAAEAPALMGLKTLSAVRLGLGDGSTVLIRNLGVKVLAVFLASGASPGSVEQALAAVVRQ